MLRVNEVVTGINIAIVFHYSSMTALLCHRTDARCHADPVCQSSIKELNIIVAYIIMYPLVEDGTKEVSPLLGSNGEVSHLTTLLHSGCQCKPIGTVYNPFNNRSKLDITTAYLLEEVIEVQWIFCIKVVDHGKGIPFHAVLVQHVDTFHHLTEGRFAGSRPSILIVKLLRSVNRDAHKKIVLLEEAAPLIIQEDAIRLNAVVNLTPTGIIPL